MLSQQFDIVIIGSGAGGGTMAHALAGTGARILVVERGGAVPSEDENWDPAAVWGQLRYRTTEHWLDGEGRDFQPYMQYVVGGNSKFWGGVLYRFRREDFEAVEHADGVSPAWPISYDTLAPYYDRGEELYHVHGQHGVDPTDPPRGPFPYPPIAHQPRMAAIVQQLRAQGLHPSPLPLGLLRPGEPGGCVLCRTCNSFPCRIRMRSDAETCGIAPALSHDNVTMWTNARADRLLTNGAGTRIAAVEVVLNGERRRVETPVCIVSCGAVNSAVLLLRSANDRHPHGLANSSGLVGRRYMAKTVAINDYYLRGPDSPFPLGQIQSQGRTHAIMAKAVGDSWVYKGIEMRHIPLWAYERWVSRATDWLAMTEDLPSTDSRVTLAPDGRIVLDYRPNNLRAHQMLVDELRRILGRLGYWSPRVFAHSVGVRNTTHQCGTLVFGTDPRSSVLDPFCRAHDVENLFVVDASFFPSSAAVNPGLTIIAQALRVAEHIAGTEVQARSSVPHLLKSVEN
jgi:choline dehydrogenase-like flavoprotein